MQWWQILLVLLGVLAVFLTPGFGIVLLEEYDQRKALKSIPEVTEATEPDPEPVNEWDAIKEKQRAYRREDIADWDRRFRELSGEPEKKVCENPWHRPERIVTLEGNQIASYCGDCIREEMEQKQLAAVVHPDDKHVYVPFMSGSMRCMYCKQERPKSHQHEIKYINGWRARCVSCDKYIPEKDKSYIEDGVYGKWSKDALYEAKKAAGL